MAEVVAVRLNGVAMALDAATKKVRVEPEPDVTESEQEQNKKIVPEPEPEPAPVQRSVAERTALLEHARARQRLDRAGGGDVAKS